MPTLLTQQQVSLIKLLQRVLSSLRNIVHTSRRVFRSDTRKGVWVKMKLQLTFWQLMYQASVAQV